MPWEPVTQTERVPRARPQLRPSRHDGGGRRREGATKVMQTPIPQGVIDSIVQIILVDGSGNTVADRLDHEFCEQQDPCAVTWQG